MAKGFPTRAQMQARTKKAQENRGGSTGFEDDEGNMPSPVPARPAAPPAAKKSPAKKKK